MPAMGDDDKLVNLKSFRKQKEQREREEQRNDRKPAAAKVSPKTAQMLVLGAFFLVILWLAMPKDFIASVMQTISG